MRKWNENKMNKTPEVIVSQKEEGEISSDENSPKASLESASTRTERCNLLALESERSAFVRGSNTGNFRSRNRKRRSDERYSEAYPREATFPKRYSSLERPSSKMDFPILPPPPPFPTFLEKPDFANAAASSSTLINQYSDVSTAQIRNKITSSSTYSFDNYEEVSMEIVNSGIIFKFLQLFL